MGEDKRFGLLEPLDEIPVGAVQHQNVGLGTAVLTQTPIVAESMEPNAESKR